MLEHLNHLRIDWKDEIPNRIVHSWDEDNLFKVRTGWFGMVAADIEKLLTEGQLTDSKKKVAGELLDWFTSDKFCNRTLNTAEDIQTVNNFLDGILGE